MSSLLSRLRSSGIQLGRVGDLLHYKSPRRLSTEQRQQLAENKARLLEELAAEKQPERTSSLLPRDFISRPHQSGDSYCVKNESTGSSKEATRPTAPLSQEALEAFIDRLRSRGVGLRWDGCNLVLYWPEIKEWPYRDALAWVDVETIRNNFGALLAHFGLENNAPPKQSLASSHSSTPAPEPQKELHEMSSGSVDVLEVSTPTHPYSLETILESSVQSPRKKQKLAQAVEAANQARPLSVALFPPWLQTQNFNRCVGRILRGLSPQTAWEEVLEGSLPWVEEGF